MRIVIEIDGKETSAIQEPRQPAPEPGPPEEPAAGGAGPGGGLSVAGSEMDSGGPPPSLLDAIAAAEATRMDGVGDQTGATDAGAAPPGL